MPTQMASTLERSSRKRDRGRPIDKDRGHRPTRRPTAFDLHQHRPRLSRHQFDLGEGIGRIFSGVLVPYLLEPYTGSATIFFGTIAVVVMIGACVPLLFGKETIGQLEMVTDVKA